MTVETYWTDTRKMFPIVFVLGLLFWGAIASASYMFPHIWIDTQSVTVDDAPANYDPMVTAYREIKQDAPLFFLVTVRDADTHGFVCSSGWRGPYNYRKAANATNPITMTLSKWMDAPSLDSIGCTAINGFGVGRFYISTCHQRRLLGLAVQRCVDSAVFERTKRKD